MAMHIDKQKNEIRFDVPNSEATINAQHFGIVDRTVGSYYMSDNYNDCITFLDNFHGEYYIDLALTIKNSKDILDSLIDKKYENAFKSFLKPQFNFVEALKWQFDNDGNFYKMKAPSVNENHKYLKLDNDDEVVNSFKSLILGDLCSLCIKRIGLNGYIFYVDKNPSFEEIIGKNTILKWMQ